MTGTANSPRNTIFNGDCTDVMRAFDTGSVDFILTDPPYVTRYRDRQDRSVRNDDNDRWLKPAFAEMHRVSKDGRFAVSFYGWNKVDLFMEAWRAAGFRIVGRLTHMGGTGEDIQEMIDDATSTTASGCSSPRWPSSPPR